MDTRQKTYSADTTNHEYNYCTPQLLQSDDSRPDFPLNILKKICYSPGSFLGTHVSV
jgi:hypothetical protein